MSGIVGPRAMSGPLSGRLSRAMSGPLSGGGAATVSIGGIAIGTPGSSGIYSGYTMVAGDDFDGPLSVIGPGAPLARYCPTKLLGTGNPSTSARLDGGGNGYYTDPLHMGNQDSNRGVSVGFNTIAQASSILTLRTRVPSGAAEIAAINGKSVADAAMISGTYLTFTPPCIIEFYEGFTQGAPAGWHPTSWVQSVHPFALGLGAPGWQEYDFPEALTGANYNAWGTVTGPGSTSGGAPNPGAGLNLYSIVMDATSAKYYVNGVLEEEIFQDTTNSLKPFQILLTSVTSSGFNLAAWQAAGATGAAMTVDYYRIWIPNAQASKVLRPAVSLPVLQADYNTALTYTFPSEATLWGAGVTDYPQAAKLEDMEPGAPVTPTTGYSRFPSDLSYNTGTRVLSGTVTSRPGRIHTTSVPYYAGGSAGYTARGYIDIGPNITTPTINLVNGVPVSRDMYSECDCGTLLPKTVSITGLPAGLSFSPTTFLITGTPTVNATTSIAIQVTNSSGQVATKNVNIVVAASIPLALDGSATATGTTQTLGVTLTTANPDDIIVVLINSNNASTSTVASISDVAGLTWQQRTIQNWNGSNGKQEIWWAHATNALTADLITITFTAAAGYTTRAVAFGVTGANLTTPFDVNAGVPGKDQAVTAVNDTRSVTISTTHADTFLIGFYLKTGGAFGTITRPAGFARIISAGTVTDPSYSIVSAAQSGVVCTTSSNGSGQTASAYIVDAIQKA